MEQLYSEAAGKFLADRFVSGTCPRCAYDDARGDQCDGCGALMNPTELLHPKCKISGTTPVVRTTRHVFLDLPKLAPDLQRYQDEASALGGWSQNCVTLTAAWMRDGLKPRCITRDLKWGIPVPLEGYRDKVFYVWFDAPIGYVSITAAYAGAGGWRRWWAPSSSGGGGGGAGSSSSAAAAAQRPDVELVQFMGKDNVPFHTVIFPATLLGASASTKGERLAGAAAADAASGGGAGADGVSGNNNTADDQNSSAEWTLMRSISVTEYLNYEGGKFSKSRGTGVFGTDARDTGIPVEVWRYYLLSVRPESSDTDFRWGDLAARSNGELLKNLGNFVNRALVFVAKFFDGCVPEPHATKGLEETRELGALARSKVEEYCALLERQKLRDGLRVAMALSADGNAFFTKTEPFRVVKVDREHASTLVAAGVGLLRVLAAMVAPFMPTMANSILQQLALPESAGRLTDGLVQACAEPHLLVPAGHRIGATAPLVREIREEEIAALKERFGGDQRADAEAAASAAAAAGGGTGAKKGGGGGGGKKGAAAAAAGSGDDDPTRPVDFSRLDVRVGVVRKAWRHPGADALYVEEVALGDGGEGGGEGGAGGGETTRQVVSGLARHLPLEQFEGRRVVALCNLKPAAVRGQMSHAMVLCASVKDEATGEERLELLEPPEGAAIGERVVVAGFERAPESQLNPRKKVFETVAKELVTDGEGVATYKGAPLMTSAGPCRAKTLTGAGVR
jgi:methionyl-tRNA synthetase